MNAEQLIFDIIKIEEYYIPKIKKNEKLALNASKVDAMGITASEEAVILNGVSAKQQYANSTVAIEDAMSHTASLLQQIVNHYSSMTPSMAMRSIPMTLDQLSDLKETIDSSDYYACIALLSYNNDIDQFRESINKLLELANLKLENDTFVVVNNEMHEVDTSKVFESNCSDTPICESIVLLINRLINTAMLNITNDYIEGANLEVFMLAVKAIVTPMKYLIAAKA